MPKISIIMPVFKTAKHLESSVASVMNQTFLDWELILVDNGGTDECPALCDKLKQKDARIKVIHLPENVGIAGARNVGLEHAQGDFIQFMDSDDQIDPEMCQALYDYAIQHQLKWVTCGFKRVRYEDMQCLQVCTTPTALIENAKEKIQFFSDEYAIVGYVWNKLFSRKMLTENKLFFRTDCDYLDDGVFILETLECVEKIGVVQSAFYQWMEHDSNSSRKKVSISALGNMQAVYNRLFAKWKNEAQITTKIQFVGYNNFLIATLLNEVKAETSKAQKIENIRHILDWMYRAPIPFAPALSRRWLKSWVLSWITGTRSASTVYICFKLLSKFV